MSKLNISLCMIASTKEEAQPFIDKYGKYFNEVILELAPNCKDFAKARNKTLKKVKTDYWFWADTDDDIENIEKLPELLTMMEINDVDIIYLRYDYGYSETGEVIAEQWRERIVRTSHPFKWVGVVHETLDSQDQPARLKNTEMAVNHKHKSIQEVVNSAQRNHEIMVDAYEKGDDDPRLIYYLGRSYMMSQQWDLAVKFFLQYTKVSGWDEQIYDAWLQISNALVQLDEYDKALNANFEAIKLIPAYPDAYLQVGSIYLALDQYDKAIKWITDGMRRQPPETLEVTDPTLYTYRPLVTLAHAYFASGNVQKAYEIIKKAEKYKPKSQTFDHALSEITAAYVEQLSIREAIALGKVIGDKGNLKKYVESLPGYITQDLRFIREIRSKVQKPKEWDNKSIVIYAGEQWEEWGPDTLAKGMGGSEEAVVYLSRELAKQGWEVTVYNERTENYEDNGVTYVPWETFNPSDEFNVFIAWRSPMMAPALKLKAKLKCVDLHDTPYGHQAINSKSAEYNDLFFFKTKYQRDYAPNLPDEKCAIINNGIVPEQFKNKVKRNTQKVLYGSSSDRGLDVLLGIWPDVKKEVPNAELSWAYGWNSYDGLHKGSTEHMKWKWGMKKKMHELGVNELGRLSHEELAKEFESSGVWAYPTSFAEISCITAIKAQVAGCKVVSSGYAALQTTVLTEEEEIENIHLKPEKLEEFKQRLIKALKEPRNEKELEDVRNKAVKEFSWSNIARQWDKAIKEHVA